MYLTGGVALFVQEVVPRSHGGSLANRYTYLTHNGCVESLFLHVHRHLVDAGHILALHYAFQINITKRCHLHAQGIVEVAFRPEYKDIWLDTHTLKLFDRMLSGLRL